MPKKSPPGTTLANPWLHFWASGGGGVDRIQKLWLDFNFRLTRPAPPEGCGGSKSMKNRPLSAQGKIRKIVDFSMSIWRVKKSIKIEPWTLKGRKRCSGSSQGGRFPPSMALGPPRARSRIKRNEETRKQGTWKEV